MSLSSNDVIEFMDMGTRMRARMFCREYRLTLDAKDETSRVHRISNSRHQFTCLEMTYQSHYRDVSSPDGAHRDMQMLLMAPQRVICIGNLLLLDI